MQRSESLADNLTGLNMNEKKASLMLITQSMKKNIHNKTHAVTCVDVHYASY